MPGAAEPGAEPYGEAPPAGGGVADQDDARASGLAGEDLRRAARTGSLVRVRHGAYVPTATWT
ncbi:type IV toxin-antitoxin system AbiEi family antitoxin domain-containing protein, partial [Cellulomonas sp. ACRRI]|uniref:type IV toxin-antitoxin system AbiEi family antitoxin domain-containing protein n=1 Tax=Cellulomonas sp. ACRRI TaxID=2918188 RepID=UPI001EF2E9BB